MWRRVCGGGAVVLAAILVVACGSDDNGEQVVTPTPTPSVTWEYVGKACEENGRLASVSTFVGGAGTPVLYAACQDGTVWKLKEK
jgi:hypothetical protein